MKQNRLLKLLRHFRDRLFKRRRPTEQIVPRLHHREEARIANLGAPKPMRLVCDAAMDRWPGMAFKLFRFREEWGVHGTHVRTGAFGSQTVQPRFRAEPDVVKETWEACATLAHLLATPAERDLTPLPLRLGMDAAAVPEIIRGIRFHAVYSPAQDLWGIIAERPQPDRYPYHGCLRTEKKISRHIFRDFPAPRGRAAGLSPLPPDGQGTAT